MLCACRDLEGQVAALRAELLGSVAARKAAEERAASSLQLSNMLAKLLMEGGLANQSPAQARTPQHG